MNRVLVIRGGAIGDFILTLPALEALRDACPNAHIEILVTGTLRCLLKTDFTRKQYARSNTDRFRASSPRIRNASGVANYFASFDLIIIICLIRTGSLKTTCVAVALKLLCGPAKIVETAVHAARQLALPIEQLESESRSY